MINHSTLYIDGKWVVPAEPGDITVINPATEQILGHAVSGGVSDVDRAVAAAREALPGWSQRSAADRPRPCSASRPLLSAARARWPSC